jgi:hypothetical protein
MALSNMVLQRLQPTGIGHLQPAILGLPRGKRGTADLVLAAQISCSQPALMLLQDPDDLLFVELLRFIRSSFRDVGLYQNLE